MLVSFSPAHRAHAPRPLHRGHLPDLRLPGGARRPVRQLRQPARPDRPDRPALAHRRLASRSSARRSICSSTCRSSPSGCAEWIALARRLASERPQLLARAARRDPAAADHARPRLGRPDPRSRLRRGRQQADLRLVRRRDRLPLGVDRVGGGERRPGRLARAGGRTPTRSTTTSRARTTSSSTP